MTPLQTLYDRFQTKVDEDLTGKEQLIFNLVDVAIGKSYKTCNHDLSYTLDEPVYDTEGNQTNKYVGNFTETLDNDEIELLALWMLYEWDRREQQRLVKQKEKLGTADFNKLEGKKEQLTAVTLAMKTTLDDIKDLKNEFNTYSYS